MHLPIKVKSPNNISKWQMGFNSAFKGLILELNIFTESLGLKKRILFPQALLLSHNPYDTTGPISLFNLP
jgi:hypothetical protein